MPSRQKKERLATAIGLLFVTIVVIAPVSTARAQVSPIIRSDRGDQQPLTHGDPKPAAPVHSASTSTAPRLAPFKLTSVRIVGSTLSQARLQSAYDSYIGHTVSAPDLADLSQRIAAIYAASSGLAFYTVSIPVQNPEAGVLKIEVTEGYVEGVRVQGPAPGRDYRLLRHYASKLTAERPLRKSTLERYVSLIRDIPGLNPSLQFAPGSRPGALGLVVTVRPKTVEVAGSINNRGTAYLGRTQLELDAIFHSLFREGDDTHLTVAAPTDGRRFQYYGISNLQPIGYDGATVQASFGYLSTHPSYFNLHGRAVSLGVQVNAPLIRRYDQSLYLTLGIDGLNSNNALLGQTLSDDRTRAVRSTVSYIRQNARYFLAASGSVSLGFDGLGARVLNPALSDSHFKKVNLKLSANIALPLDTILRLDSAAQYTPDRLPGAEFFALGGDEFGRAYEAAAITGDRGVAGSAEFAWKLSKLAPPSFAGSEIYSFADVGRTETIVRPGLPSANLTLASVGGGGRLAIGSKAILQLEIARGLTNPIITENHESWRGIFSLKSLFW